MRLALPILFAMTAGCIEAPTGALGNGGPDFDVSDDGVGADWDASGAPITQDYGVSEFDRISGDMGFVRDFDEAVYMRSVWSDGYGTHIEAHVQGPGGWAMIATYLDGPLGVAPLVPGNTVFLSGVGQDAGDDGVEGDTIGCSGPDEWQFDFDEPSEGTEIALSLHPSGDWQLDITADFGRDGVVQGTVVVPPPAE